MELPDGDWDCTFTTSSPQETEALGKALGSHLGAGDTVALIGELGSGKTCFAKGVAAGMGIERTIPIVSPTFTLLNEYPGSPPLYHFDLYRIDGAAQVADLGCEEYFGGEGVAIIEWGEKAAEFLPGEHVRVEFFFEDEDKRKVIFKGTGKRFAALRSSLQTIAATESEN